ncbi:hypothetical protein BDY24DRAFT_405505, partial [Mrakia frigida]|uniref:uncharacterized protein n=1 Tax=Mrakia frigida TaxID=29902 RepID=UPI003FCBF6C0
MSRGEGNERVEVSSESSKRASTSREIERDCSLSSIDLLVDSLVVQLLKPNPLLHRLLRCLHSSLVLLENDPADLHDHVFRNPNHHHPLLERPAVTADKLLDPSELLRKRIEQESVVVEEVTLVVAPIPTLVELVPLQLERSLEVVLVGVEDDGSGRVGGPPDLGVEEVARKGEVDGDDGGGGEESFEDGRFPLLKLVSDRAVDLLPPLSILSLSLEHGIHGELEETILLKLPPPLVVDLVRIPFEKTDVSEVRELDLRNGDEVVLDLQRVPSLLDYLFDPLESEVDIRFDVELSNPVPPSLCLPSSANEDALLGMEEVEPVLWV